MSTEKHYHLKRHFKHCCKSKKYCVLVHAACAIDCWWHSTNRRWQISLKAIWQLRFNLSGQCKTSPTDRWRNTCVMHPWFSQQLNTACPQPPQITHRSCLKANNNVRAVSQKQRECAQSGSTLLCSQFCAPLKCSNIWYAATARQYGLSVLIKSLCRSLAT